MSLALLQAVLLSNHTKSSTRFAQVLLAYHACSRCGRVYVSKQRLAAEMNIAPRDVQALLKRLRADDIIEPTGETTPTCTPVYRLVGGDEIITRMKASGDESITQ
jgi:CRP-like cAMP-binding protein